MADTAPDFGRPVADGALLGFVSTGGRVALALPRRLILARRPDGSPALRLAIVKSAAGGMEGAYAALDLEAAADVPLDATLAAARAAVAGATVRPADIDGGFAHLVSIGQAAALPEDAMQPVALGIAGGGFARWTTRLRAETGEMIADTLGGGALAIGGRVLFQLRGVAARAPANVRFSPAGLIARLAPAGVPITPLDLLAALAGPAAGLGLTLDRPCDAAALAQAMADRLTAAYGTLVPLVALDPSAPPVIALAAPADGSETVWDLSQPGEGLRCYALALDMLDGLPADRDAASALVTRVAVPPLDLGWRAIEIYANLPGNRTGVPALGVTIALAADPPVRPSPVTCTVALTAPDDHGTAHLQIGAGEALTYTIAGFAVVAASGAVHQYDALPRPGSEAWLQLQASDFPIGFTHVTASARLLVAAAVSGQLAYTIDGRAMSQPISLDGGHAELAVAVPQGAQGAALTLVATPVGGTGDGVPHAMAALAPGRIRLDLASFPGYGPQRVQISAALAAEDGPLVLAVVPDQADASAAATVTLTAAQPQAVWGYAAASPFRAGYRYRVADGAWSDSLSPLLPLLLEKDGTMTAGVMAFNTAGVRWYADPAHPATVWYLPALPVPERDAHGRPSLMLVHSAGPSFLQLGAHYALEAGGETALLAAIAASQPAFAASLLQPAPVSVLHAAVVLTDQAGQDQELASASASGFPPHAAVFSATMTQAQASLAIAAVRGRAGVLFVDYTLSLPATVSAVLDGAPATLRARADIASWFPGGAGDLHIKMAA